MANLRLNFDEYIPLREIVFKSLSEAIILGELQPGERLMETKLADELGVSRTPVREAIKKLEQEGLVKMTARKGAEVAPINAEDLQEVLEIRKAMETLAVELACNNATKDDIKRLRDANAAISKAIKTKDVEDIMDKDLKFHEAIQTVSRSKRLQKMLDQLRAHIYRYRYAYIRDMKNKETIVEEHTKIIDCIEEKNVRAARKEVELHIEAQEKFIMNVLQGIDKES